MVYILIGCLSVKAGVLGVGVERVGFGLFVRRGLIRKSDVFDAFAVSSG